jgi:hypothetical protein
MCLGLVEERAEYRGPPVPEVAVLLEPVLEQSFDSLQRFKSRQRGRGRPDGSSLNLTLTAVHEEFTSGDVTAFVGCEERDRFGNFIRGSRSAQRNDRSDGLDVVV